MDKYIVNNLEQLKEVAEKLVSKFTSKERSPERATVVALSGDLGAGKTTLVQMIARELEIKDTVNSPTFTIMKIYPVVNNSRFKQLVHMDAYRLEEVLETVPLRISELFLDTGNLICIEWAEKIAEILPKDTINITIKTLPENRREITEIG